MYSVLQTHSFNPQHNYAEAEEAGVPPLFSSTPQILQYPNNDKARSGFFFILIKCQPATMSWQE